MLNGYFKLWWTNEIKMEIWWNKLIIVVNWYLLESLPLLPLFRCQNILGILIEFINSEASGQLMHINYNGSHGNIDHSWDKVGMPIWSQWRWRRNNSSQRTALNYSKVSNSINLFGHHLFIGLVAIYLDLSPRLNVKCK